MTDIDADLVTRAVAKADAEAPTVGQVAEVLADSGLVDADIDRCYQAVEDAIGAGHVVEGDDGALGGVRVPDDTCETESDESEAEDGTPSYADLFDAARRRAGREPWEHVEEEHLRAVLEEHDLGHLLDTSALYNTAGWRHVDLSDEEEPPDPRWYYATGEEPRPEEFRRFHELLMEAAPDGYTPHYFRVARAGKDPATQFGGWKQDEARLTVKEAVDWMEKGGNIGIAGRGGCRGCGGRASGWCPECEGDGNDDRLVNVDIDDDEETTPDDVPASLRARSRSRTGWHTWYFDGGDQPIPNIPTDDYGEVRTDWQYVVAPGSFVASAAEEIPDDADHAGYYTVEDAEPVASIEYQDLPDVFIEAAEAATDEDDESDGATDAGEAATDEDDESDGATDAGDGLDLDDGDLPDDRGSAVFDIEAADLVTASDASDRFGSIFHDSQTGANMSVSGGKLHCWRHLVAHGGLQALATLSDKTKHGCKALGAPHKNSNAGSNRLKGDWELVWAAWHYAKRDGLLPDDDPLPYRALLGLALEGGVVEDADDFVERDQGTGDIVEDTEAHDGDTYTALPPGTYNDALEYAAEQADVSLGREPVETADDSPEDGEQDTDSLAIDVTVDPRAAWRAAGAVAPADLDCEPPADSDGDGFACPDCGDRVDIVRAVAIAEGFVEDCTDDLAGDYPRAYETAREAYGAPLPRYYTTTDAVAEMEAVIELKNQLGFFDLDHEAMESEITERGDEVGGEAVLALNPSWRDSFSESSVLVYESGNVWDADTERNFRDMLHFVALDAGVIDDIACYPRKTQFVEAYRLARNEYGAPLPRWVATDTDLDRDLQAMLPDREELEADAGPPLGVDTDALEDARDAVEELVKEATAEPDQPTVISAFPGTGKTTGTVKTARSRPLSYLAARKELQAQALDKAERWGVEARILPVFAEDRIREEVLADAVSHVREAGKDRLRDQHGILAAAVGDDEDQGSIFEEDDDEDDDTVDLDRPTCDTAEGRHGPAWALAFHVARELGYTPQQIHDQALGLFGAHPPCGCESDASDDGDCPYSVGWEEAADPDDPADLLVGSYVHAHVESVRTLRTRGPDGRIQRSPRPVVLDEYPGNAYVSRFGEEALDHATWLACALRDDVADRRDMVNADLHGDDWVRAWLDGNGADIDAIADASDRLARLADLYEAEDGAADILDRVADDDLAEADLHDPLAALADGGTDARVLYRDLASAIGAIDPADEAAGLADWVRDVVLDPLASATLEGAETPTVDAIDTDALPASGELAGLVETAVEAAAGGDPNAPAAIDAAVTALGGGTEGCRRLAAWADDGYAHPDAHHLLRGVITPTGEDTDHDGLAARVATDEWAFDPDATDGTVVDTVDTGERARVVLDRNDHGALLRTPPARTAGNGDPTPLVGLDATARAPLWGQSLGESVLVADIHDTPAERAAFAADALGLKVIRAADRPRFYEGDPRTKDTDGDVTLLRRIAEDYSGLQAPRERGAEPVVVGKPAAITTKGVRNLLESDSRLDDVVAEWANYGDMKGANGFGGYQLGAVLGCQHYGDAAIERFAAMAGEEVNTDRGPGRGGALDYESDIANAYLKHMTEDQTMQAILRFSRGESGATVVARTSALRDDLPVVGRGQVVETWSETATRIAAAYRRLGDRFTVADVADTVDVTKRQVRRVLAELAEAGYVRTVRDDPGIAKVYEPAGAPGAGEASLPAREDVVEVEGEAPGQGSSNEYYTWNVRVVADLAGGIDAAAPAGGPAAAGPPAPEAAVGLRPPD